MTDKTNDTYPNAGRASGYVTDQGLSVGEDLVNKITGIIAAHQTKALLESAKTRELIAGIAEQGDAIERVLSDERLKTHASLASFQQHLDARLDYRDHEFDQFRAEARAAWEVGAAETKKLAKEVAGLKSFEGESREDRAAMHEEIAQLRAEIAGIRSTIEPYMAGNRRAELGEALRKIARLEARLADEQAGDGA